MKAIIFAAGLGKRLKPLTDKYPKALVEINGKPLLWYALQKVINTGVNEIIINAHHFGEQIIDYVNHIESNIPIHISDERDQLLDTGGGLLKAKCFLTGDAPIIAYNVDIISSIDLNRMIAQHKQTGALATLAVRNRKTSRYLMLDQTMQLTGWHNKLTGENKIARTGFDKSEQWAFSGVHIISPAIFNLITEKGKFSIIELYLRLAHKHNIKGYIDTSDFWFDVGKPEQLEAAHKHIINNGYL